MSAMLADPTTNSMPTSDERRWIEAERTAARRRVFEDAIPLEHQGADLADLDDDCRHELLTWLASDEPTLVLSGPSGSGKSYAAYALLRCAAGSGARVYGATLGAVVDSTKPNAAHSPAGRLAIDADLFLFDNVETCELTAGSGRLDGILRHRHAEGKRQIITTTPAISATVVGFCDDSRLAA